MVTKDNLQIYLAIRKPEVRSSLEDQLVLDGFDVSTFSTAGSLWPAFQHKPVRFIITDRRFDEDYGGLDLIRDIRQHYLLPYVYVVMLSYLNRLAEIKEGLAVGVDDYIIKPHNPFQIRSRVLVGMRWLNYIDSLYAGKSVSK